MSNVVRPPNLHEDLDQSRIYINRSVFNAVHGNLNHYHINGEFHSEENEHGLKTLSKVISVDALHDAGARFPPPNCHPDTRKLVRNKITLWIEDSHSPHDILWLHGSTGVGKSAIAQKIAEWCYSRGDRLAASFFFSRGKYRRDDGQYLFPTIAYQLALNLPSLRQHVNDAMSNDSTLPYKNVDMQLKALIIEPFQKLSISLQRTSIVIIDALDECKDARIQRRILELISNLFESFQIPLRFLIVSRSEAHIRETFASPLLAQRTLHIDLDGSFQSDRDIKLYLRHEFSVIAERKKRVLAHVSQPWPPKSAINKFAAKASGQFVYAVTLVEFIGAEGSFPHERLENLLQASSSQKAFSSLDELYTQILKTYEDPGFLLRILLIMVTLHCPQPPEVYDDLLGVNRGYVADTLCGMHSLVKFPNDVEDEMERAQRAEHDQTPGLRLRHASFMEFLLDNSRSGKFFIDPTKTHVELTKSGISLLLKGIAHAWSCNREGPSPSRETWGYLKNHLNIHLSQCLESDRHCILETLEQFSPISRALKPLQDPAWDLVFDALHSLNTALAKVIHPDRNLTTWNISDHSHWANETTLDEFSRLDDTVSQDSSTVKLYHKYRKFLDDFYVCALSQSDDVLQFLASVPGFMIRKRPIPISWIEDIFGTSSNALLTNTHTSSRFIHRWKSHFWTPGSQIPEGASEVILLNAHLASFLFNPERAGKYHRSPETLHINASRDVIKMIFHPDWARRERQHSFYSSLEEMLRNNLESINLDPLKDYTDHSDHHVTVALIEDFSSIVYDIPCLEEALPSNVKFIWNTTRKILHWIQRQKSKVKKWQNPTSPDFNKLLKDANDNIYRQILCIDPSIHEQQTVTLCRPFIILANPQAYTTEVRPEQSSSIPVPIPLPLSPSDPPSNHISDALLALHGVRYSLVEFLTRKERAGPLYVHQNTYHTQFAEICLHYCDPEHFDLMEDWRTLLAHTEWKFHLMRAQPNTQLLGKLREIRPGPWLSQGGSTKDTEGKIKSVRDIVHWLEHMSQTPADILCRWKTILKDLSLETRKTLPRKRDLEALGQPQLD